MNTGAVLQIQNSFWLIKIVEPFDPPRPYIRSGDIGAKFIKTSAALGTGARAIAATRRVGDVGLATTGGRSEVPVLQGL